VASKYAEAYVLFRRACEHAESALKRLQQLSFPEEQQRQELEELRDRSTGEACVVHAQGVMETARSQAKAQDSLQKGVAAISLKGKPTSTEVNIQMTVLLIITWF
jgi:hypothetical protein